MAGVFLESTTEFTVDARSVVPRGGKVKAFVTAPSGTRTEALVNNNNDGTYKCMYTPYEQGKSTVVSDGLHKLITVMRLMEQSVSYSSCSLSVWCSIIIQLFSIVML